MKGGQSANALRKKKKNSEIFSEPSPLLLALYHLYCICIFVFPVLVNVDIR